MKVLLDTHFPAATRIWLAPEHLEQALNEAERARFGIAHPLIRVLDAAVTPENFLIIDSAEHLSAPSRIKATQLIKQLLELNPTVGLSMVGAPCAARKEQRGNLFLLDVGPPLSTRDAISHDQFLGLRGRSAARVKIQRGAKGTSPMPPSSASKRRE